MACGNMNQIYGLTFQEHSLSERQIRLLLHDMVKKGMICVVQNQLMPCEKYNDLLELVKSAVHFLSFEYVCEDALKRGSLYLGEQLLWVENSNCRRETYEMTQINKNDWEEWMSEQHFFPCYQSQETESDWREVLEVQEGENRFRVQMCKVETGEIGREIFLYERKGKEYLMRREGKMGSFIAYHQKHLLEEVKSWI